MEKLRSDLKPPPNTVAKIIYRQTADLNVKGKTRKPFKENIEENLHDLGVDKDSLNKTENT